MHCILQLEIWSKKRLFLDNFLHIIDMYLLHIPTLYQGFAWYNPLLSDTCRLECQEEFAHLKQTVSEHLHTFIGLK